MGSVDQLPDSDVKMDEEPEWDFRRDAVGFHALFRREDGGGAGHGDRTAGRADQ